MTESERRALAFVPGGADIGRRMDAQAANPDDPNAGSKKSAGPAPDYRGAAEETAASSAAGINAQTQANRPNQNTPWATSSWTKGPDGQWTQNTNFTGGIGSAAQGLTAQLGSLSNPFDVSRLMPIGTGEQARDQAIDASWKQAMSRLNPQWEQRESAERNRLINMGFDPESEGFRTAMGNLGRERNDAYDTALSSAIAGGREAGDSVFRNNLAGRTQGLAEGLQLRSLPLQELSGLQSFLAMPGFNSAGAADPTNYFAAAGAGGAWRQAEADRQQQLWSDLAGGLMGLASGGMSFIPRGK